jgi:hypothetical protein
MISVDIFHRTLLDDHAVALLIADTAIFDTQ